MNLLSCNLVPVSAGTDAVLGCNELEVHAQFIHSYVNMHPLCHY